MCAFQPMKSVYDGIARHNDHNDLVGTDGDFSLSDLTHTVHHHQRNRRDILVHFPLLV